MFDAFAATLFRAHSLYRNYPRHLFDTGAYLGLFAIFLGTASFALLATVAWHLGRVPHQIGYSELGDHILEGTMTHHNFPAEGFGALLIALFASGVLRDRSLLYARVGIGGLFKHVPARSFRNFLIVWVLLFLIHLALYKAPFDPLSIGTDSAIWQPQGLGESKMIRLMEWGNVLANTVARYAAYPLALGILDWNKDQPVMALRRTQLRDLLFTVLLLAFCFQSLYGSFWYLIDTVIAPPLLIPFGSEALAIAISITLQLALIAYVIPFLTLLFATPMEHYLAAGTDRSATEQVTDDDTTHE